MIQIILFFFVLLPFCTFSQVHESFDGTEINAGYPWKGDLNSFRVTTDGWLQLDAPADGKKAAIFIPLDYTENMEWTFDVKLDFEPTNQNYVRFYVYSTNIMGCKDNYYIQIGSNDRDITFRRLRETEKTPKKLIIGQAGLLKQESISLTVKLTLENNGCWKLYTRIDGQNGYTLQGTFEEKMSGIQKGDCFKLECTYSKKRAQLFFFDNIIVSNQITETPLLPDKEPEQPEEKPEDDLTPPILLEFKQESATELLMIFDEVIDPARYQLSLSGLGEVTDVYISEDEKTLKLVWDKAMQKDINYTFYYAGLFDKSGNECKGDTTFLSIYGEKQVEVTKPGSIVINEIMADPKGLNNMQVEDKLPDTEYVELYNTTDSEISLTNWQFSYGGSAKPIGSLVLSGRSHAVLYRAGRDIKIDMTGKAWPMDNFPASLANTGKTLQLLDPADNIIDEVTYSKATPAKSWERSSSDEWYLSTDPRGGTPGSENSSQEEEKPVEPEQPSEPDDPAPPVVSSVLQGEIVFNELLPDPYTGGSEYIELYNRSDKTLSISGLSVATRKMDGMLSTHYPLSSASRMLNPGEFALITKSIEGVSSFYLISSPEALCEVVKLPVLANTSSTLVLFRTSDETVIDEVSYSSKWHASSIKDKKGVALERISPEGETQEPANWTSASEVVGYGTPGYQNSQYHSSADGDATGIEDPIYQEDRHNYIIPYHLDQPGYNCRIFIYAISGQRISEIANHELLGTNGQLTWDGILSNGRSLQAGVYILYAEIYHPSGKVLRYKKPFLVH